MRKRKRKAEKEIIKMDKQKKTNRPNVTPIHSLGEIEGAVRMKLLSVKNQTSQKDYGYWVVTIVFASPPWGLHSDSIILLVKNVLRVSARFLYP